ncbi:MAG TPA: LytTR family DNA-binding domain-containing protein [Brevundimonas sp.]
MPRISFAAAIGAFAAYSYGATAVSAAWFLRRDYGFGLVPSIVWAALLFSPWVVVGLMVWAVLNRISAPARAITVLATLVAPVVPATALASTLIDSELRKADWTWSVVVERSVDRLPVAILLYTAVAACGLAAVWWRRADRQRREIGSLSAALKALRSAQAAEVWAPSAATALIVSMGRRRVPVHPAEIEWVSSAGNYAVVHWSDGGQDQEGLLRETLQALATRLEPARFARGHRSTLINLAHVAELKPLADGAWRATMDSGAELVVSRTHRDVFLARLGRR